MMNENVETMTGQATATASQASETAQAAFAKMGDGATAALEKGKAALDEMAQFGRGNVEAMLESSKIAARGIETMGQDAAAYARNSFEATTAAWRQMAGITSPADLFRLHGDYVRATIDSMVAHTSRSTEATLKLAGEIAAPLQNRVALATDRLKTAA